MMARLSWYLDPLSPYQLKMFIKQEVKFGPPMTKRSVSARVKDCNLECLTRDRRVTGSSLTCHTAAVCVLEQDTLISSKYCFNPGRST